MELIQCDVCAVCKLLTQPRVMQPRSIVAVPLVPAPAERQARRVRQRLDEEELRLVERVLAVPDRRVMARLSARLQWAPIQKIAALPIPACARADELAVLVHLHVCLRCWPTRKRDSHRLADDPGKLRHGRDYA